MLRDRIIKSHLKTRFLISMQDKSAIEGLLIDADKNHIQLADCFAVDNRGNKTSVDGNIYIPRNQILYMQKP